MRDLTQGAIWRHLVGMAMFIAAGLIANTLYILIDLYFVAGLGKQAMAGVASAGSAMFITMSIAQLVGVGSLSLVSHAVGRKDQADAQLVFEQALSLSLLIAAMFLIAGYGLGGWAVSRIAADSQTADYARTYLFYYLPALATMFPSAAMGSALRASGVVVVPMLLQSGTVALNAVLAPVLIRGWGTGHPFGVIGAGLASSIAAVLGMVALGAMFNRAQTYMRLHSSLHPRLQVWKRIAAIGLPATGEFALIFITTAVGSLSIRGLRSPGPARYRHPAPVD